MEKRASKVYNGVFNVFVRLKGFSMVKFPVSRFFHSLVCTTFLFPASASFGGQKTPYVFQKQNPTWTGVHAEIAGTQDKNTKRTQDKNIVTLRCGMTRNAKGQLVRKPEWDSLTRTDGGASIIYARGPNGMLLIGVKRDTFGALGGLKPDGTILTVSGETESLTHGLLGVKEHQYAPPAPLFDKATFTDAALEMTVQCAANMPVNWDPGTVHNESVAQSLYVEALGSLVATLEQRKKNRNDKPVLTAPATAYPRTQKPSPTYETPTTNATFSPPVTGKTSEPPRAQPTTPAIKTTSEFVKPGDIVRLPPQSNTSPSGQQTSGTRPVQADTLPQQESLGDYLPKAYREAHQEGTRPHLREATFHQFPNFSSKPR